MLRNDSILTIGALVFLSGGCTRRMTYVEIPVADASFVLDVGTCLPECYGVDSDSCNTQGECTCGIGPVCSAGRDCYVGRCIESDLTQPAGCEFHGDCPESHACIEARCTFVESCTPSPEVCDGIDNDCDGLVDNAGIGPLSEFCIGDSSDIESFHAPCRRGVRACLGGEWQPCSGDVTPIPEQGGFGCDMVDNDCDGCIDGQLIDGVCQHRPNEIFDVVYVVDRSPSMVDEIDAVNRAIQRHYARYSSLNFRFALVMIGEGEYPFFHTRQDFTSVGELQTSLEYWMSHADPNLSEPSWTAIEALGSGRLPVSWRIGSNRIIILFTDERGQDSASSETRMCHAMSHGESLTFFINPVFARDFDDCGEYYGLTLDDLEMSNHLDEIIQDPCF